MDVLDANMPLFIRQWLFNVAPVVVTVVLICYSTPIFVVILIPLVVIYIIMQVSQISKHVLERLLNVTFVFYIIVITMLIQYHTYRGTFHAVAVLIQDIQSIHL